MVHRQTSDFNRAAAHLKRPMVRVYGTSVTIGGEGILLRGPSGSGKSDLALRLIDEGALLVADDQTELRQVGASLEMTPPPSLAGLLEVRGLGIVRVPHAARAPLCLIVDLAPEAAIERLPEPRAATIEGIEFPLLTLHPFAVSATAKLRMALKALNAPMLAGALAAP